MTDKDTQRQILQITMSPCCREAFIRYACRLAKPAICINFCGSSLHICGMTAEAAASAMAYAVFPAAEKHLLRRILQKKKTDPLRAAKLIALAQTAARQDIPLCPLYMGSGREDRLKKEFEQLLEKGRLDMEGFYRFRLKGYEEYLRILLIRAEEEIEAREEDERCNSLFKAELGKGRGTVTLFFYPHDICQLWISDEKGSRLLEGGHIQGAEWILISRLITMDPAVLRVHNSDAALPGLMTMLENIFGSRLETVCG